MRAKPVLNTLPPAEFEHRSRARDACVEIVSFEDLGLPVYNVFLRIRKRRWPLAQDDGQHPAVFDSREVLSQFVERLKPHKLQVISLYGLGPDHCHVQAIRARLAAGFQGDELLTLLGLASPADG